MDLGDVIRAPALEMRNYDQQDMRDPDYDPELQGMRDSDNDIRGIHFENLGDESPSDPTEIR